MAPDESQQLLLEDHGRIANCRIWIYELTLVLRDIETEHKLLPVEEIAEKTRQLSADVQMLQRVIHRMALVVADPREMINLHHLAELESRYNGLVERG